MYASLAYGYTGIAYFCYDHGERDLVPSNAAALHPCG